MTAGISSCLRRSRAWCSRRSLQPISSASSGFVTLFVTCWIRYECKMGRESGCRDVRGCSQTKDKSPVKLRGCLSGGAPQEPTNRRRGRFPCVKSGCQHEGATVGIGPPPKAPALLGGSLWSAAHLALPYRPRLLLCQPERGGADLCPLRRYNPGHPGGHRAPDQR